MDSQFQERIILAVTSVNDCKYCSYFHSKMAIEHGCQDEEINSILKRDFSCSDNDEIPALAFAQHFAESHEHPSAQSVAQLLNHYGKHKTFQILATCFMITWGNLFGNTIDAYGARLEKRNNTKKGKLFEGILYYLATPIMNKI